MGGIIRNLKSNDSNKFKNYTPSTNLNKDGCRVDCKNFIRPYYFIDLDSPELGFTKRRCDYLIFADNSKKKESLIIPLELKSGALKASDAVEQLQGGADIAQRLYLNAINYSNNNSNRMTFSVKFRPFVFFNKHHNRQLDVLRKERIFFNKVKHPIEWGSCGEKIKV